MLNLVLSASHQEHVMLACLVIGSVNFDQLVKMMPVFLLCVVIYSLGRFDESIVEKDLKLFKYPQNFTY